MCDMEKRPDRKVPAKAAHRLSRATAAPVFAVLALAAAVALGLQFLASQAAPPAGSIAPASSAPLVSGAVPAPSDQPLNARRRLPAASAPLHLRIDSAEIDLAVLPLEPTKSDLASQSIVPPYTFDAYWLANLGKPGRGSDNTVYITGHSWEDREAPFDRLSTHVGTGDRIILTTRTGKLEYTVESVTTHNKDTLKDSDIWNIVPNRLVLISCYTEDPWGKNVIVTARPSQ
jgi:hypothetical protein